MPNNFIKLHTTGGNEVTIKADRIEFFMRRQEPFSKNNPPHTNVRTFSGHNLFVTESPQEIESLLGLNNDSNATNDELVFNESVCKHNGSTQIRTVGDKGCSMVNIPNNVNNGFPVLSFMFVEEEHRRQGVGAKLLDKAERAAKKYGFTALEIHIEDKTTIPSWIFGWLKRMDYRLVFTFDKMVKYRKYLSYWR